MSRQIGSNLLNLLCPDRVEYSMISVSEYVEYMESSTLSTMSFRSPEGDLHET